MDSQGLNFIRLALFCAACMGWQVFKDGPLAHYIASGLLVAWLAIERALAVKGKAWAVYAFCALHGITTSACGGLFASLSDARHYLCDRGTGQPVSLITGSLALAVVLYLSLGSRNA